MAPERFDSPEYLAKQYNDSTNLNTRIRLHNQFSVNHYGWPRWVFDQFHLQPESKILELGCGQGGLWRENLDRIPEKWHIILSDFSEGMILDAQQNLAGTRDFEFWIIDAQVSPLPFADASFDAVIANHVLPHISERQCLFSEIVRVLKPDGRLYASTVGQRHLTEIADLINDFDPELGAKWESPMVATDSFTLDNGRNQLAPWFTDIRLHRYEDALVVDEISPLLDYIFSYRFDLEKDRQEPFKKFVQQKMETQGGVLHITKDSGMFEAIRK